VQPGYYVMKDPHVRRGRGDPPFAPASRVGNVQIKAGEQLDDTKKPRQLGQAGVRPRSPRQLRDAERAKKCVSADDLRKRRRPPTGKLGLPDWAVPEVARPTRRTAWRD